jgi:hypothetical protein
MKSNRKLKIAQFGLGPIGIETVKAAAQKPWAEVIGGIDIAPEKAGRSLGQLTGEKKLKPALVYSSLEDLLKYRKPDIIFHTAVSRLESAFVQIEPMIRAGIDVISSCEELLFPALRNPRLAARLDALCRKFETRVIGTGVNPGFVMDVLPLCMTGVSHTVSAVHVQRVVNASTRRAPLQRKIGSGLPPAEFRRLFAAGNIGHAGLKESLALLAFCLGWKVQNISELGEPVVAKRPIKTQFLEVKKGQTCGLHQRAEATLKGRVCLSLDLKMYLGASDPHDAIQIEGDPPLDLLIKGGVAGDKATVAALLNTAPRLHKSPPGLLLMSDLTLPRLG